MLNPNIFKFATSELSQDIFICWLLSFADDRNRSDTKQQALNAVAQDILKLMFTKAEIAYPSQIQITVKRQFKKIDIMCIINDDYCLIIEDKVGTKVHSNQLIRYKNTIANVNKLKDMVLIPIYLQTHDESSYHSVEKDGYSVVGRRDLLDIFNQEKHQSAQELSDIYQDYVSYLQDHENAVNQFRHQPIVQWKKSGKAWTGLFLHLQTKISDAKWGYVSNPNGGFMGLWCFWQAFEDYSVYFQIEETKACFKVRVKNKEEGKKIRNRLYKVFTDNAKKYDVDIIKPKRFSLGKTMTFAVLKDSWFETEDTEQVLDLDVLEQDLAKIEIFIKDVSKLM